MIALESISRSAKNESYDFGLAKTEVVVSFCNGTRERPESGWFLAQFANWLD